MQSYNLAGPGMVFYTCKQSFRFATFDRCGNLKTWPCKSSFTVNFVNDGNNKYHIEHK